MRLACLFVVTATAIVARPLSAQDTAPTEAAPMKAAPMGTAKPLDFDVFLQVARKYVVRRKGRDEPLKLHPRSLLNWGNPTRKQERGGVFVWLGDGRPAVVGSVFTYEFGGKSHFKHELQSLSQSPLTAHYSGGLAWSPTAAGIRWESLGGAPRPASSERLRLLQLRQIARRFTVTLEDGDGEKTTLRLAPQPLFRYKSEPQNVQDGAIFSFVVATDPDALLLVELAGEPGQEQWRYAFAPLHFWRLTAVDEAGEPVWTSEPDRSHVNNPFGNPANLKKTYNSFRPPDRPEDFQNPPDS